MPHGSSFPYHHGEQREMTHIGEEQGGSHATGHVDSSFIEDGDKIPILPDPPGTRETGSMIDGLTDHFSGIKRGPAKTNSVRKVSGFLEKTIPRCGFEPNGYKTRSRLNLCGRKERRKRTAIQKGKKKLRFSLVSQKHTIRLWDGWLKKK